VIDVQRVDYIRIPVTDMQKANQFYGEVLGLERNPNSADDDWVEYETGNVTLAVMTPHTHDYEFTPLPPGTIAFRVPTWPRRRRSWRRPAWRSMRCGIRASVMGPGSATRTATPSFSTTATSRTSRPDVKFCGNEHRSRSTAQMRSVRLPRCREETARRSCG
jgi:hypothetical protein